MSTYLQLSQRALQEAGVSGTIASVSGLTGELKRIADWVSTAWDDIQEMHSTWAWMYGTWSFNTVASTGAYTPATVGLTDFRWWDEGKARLYKSSLGVSDEGTLPFIGYSDWYDTYNIGTQTDNRPVSVAVRPSDSALLLGPVPDAVYVVSGIYWKALTQLSSDSDTPACPADYHMAIVWKALMYFYAFEEAASRFDFAREMFSRWINRLERNQLPRLEVGAEPIGFVEEIPYDTGFDID